MKGEILSVPDSIGYSVLRYFFIYKAGVTGLKKKCFGIQGFVMESRSHGVFSFEGSLEDTGPTFRRSQRSGDRQMVRLT